MSKQPSWPVAITSLGPVDAGAVLWRKSGRLWLTIVAKATFSFAPGGALEPAEPIELRRAELHHGDNPMRSVRASSDLAPFLQYADVLFVGNAYAPGGRPTPSFGVRIGLARGATVLLDKTLEVTGDRVATPGQPIPDPTPFTKMPIAYERAFGGLGSTDNPLGVGLALKKGKKEALPNITYADPAKREVPAGFGPISCYWPTRKNLLRQHSRKLLEQRVAEIPDDFDAAYFQSAPADQRVPFLRGDEIVLLHGLHPTHTTLQMRLPAVRGAARVHTPNGAETEIALNADMLLIDGDAERCALTFRGVYPVGSEELLAGLRIFAGVEIGGRAIAWPAPAPVAQASAPAEEIEIHDLDEFDAVEDGETTVPRAPSAPAAPAGGNWEATYAMPEAEAARPMPVVAPFALARPAAGAAPRASAGTPWAATPEAPRRAPEIIDDETAMLEEGTALLSIPAGLPAATTGFSSPVAPPDDRWEGTFVLPEAEAARPKPVAAPFPLAAAGAAPPSSHQPIPGAPWSPLRAPSRTATPPPDTLDDEGTVSDVDAAPAPPAAAPSAPEPPKPAPKVIPAEPSKPWSWLETAPPKADEPPPKAPAPPPKPAVKTMIYGAFGAKKK